MGIILNVYIMIYNLQVKFIFSFDSIIFQMWVELRSIARFTKYILIGERSVASFNRTRDRERADQRKGTERHSQIIIWLLEGTQHHTIEYLYQPLAREPRIEEMVEQKSCLFLKIWKSTNTMCEYKWTLLVSIHASIIVLKCPVVIWSFMNALKMHKTQLF